MGRVGTIYRQDGTKLEATPENGVDFKIEELNEIVGGFIEVVYLSGTDLMMVMNDEGKMLERCRPNGAATDLWAASYGYTDVIFGNVLVCKNDMVK